MKHTHFTVAKLKAMSNIAINNVSTDDKDVTCSYCRRIIQLKAGK